MAGWTAVEEIEAYRLSVELRDAIIDLTSDGPVTRDYKFRDQIRDSAASAARNLSEGFDRFEHPQFAHLANVAKGSLGETKTALEDGHKRGYFTREETARLCKVAKRAAKATAGLIRYLQRTPTPKCRPPAKKSEHRAPAPSTEHQH